MFDQEKCSLENALFNSVLLDPLFQRSFNTKKIKVVAPASGACLKKIETLKQATQINIEIPSNIVTKNCIFHANSDEERFSQLETAFYDKSNDIVIWALRGGYGSARLINKLSELKAPKQEKIFIGFSDITALHLFLSQQWNWHTIHGCGLIQILDKNQDPKNYFKIADIVSKKQPMQSISNLKPLNKEAVKRNKIEGCLTGGNLTLVENSIGTSWQVKTAGKIVFLEDTGEKGYRIDRSLYHLWQAGLLKEVAAIIFGDFIIKTKNSGISIALERFAKDINIPVYKTNQFGHGKINYPLVYNSMAKVLPSSEKDHYELQMMLSKEHARNNFRN
jgi:muramoyltetrapeptide carboxypeptidase